MRPISRSPAIAASRASWSSRPCSPHLADAEYAARFWDEAKVVVKLSHGNLIPVFDAGLVGGELFLAMDFVEGRNLRAVWNRCAKKQVAFPIDVAVYIVKELCRGLAYAHSFPDLNLVHRDISPHNVLVSYTGEVKLTDFGLASSTLKLEKTAPGIIYDKVPYMSPEQARGEKLDGRSDMYAAAIVLWELLTGRQLFPPGKDQPQDLLARAKNPEVMRPSKRAPRVPVEFDEICLKALAADKSARYADCDEMRMALQTWLARNAPIPDGTRMASFLQELFAEDIVLERDERVELIRRARALTLPPTDELRLIVEQSEKASLPADAYGAQEVTTETPVRWHGSLGRRTTDRGDEADDRRRQGDRRLSGRASVPPVARGVGAAAARDRAVTFDQEVRDFLEEVDRRPRSLKPLSSRHIDVGALHEHFLIRLRELESEVATDRVDELFGEWSPKQLALLAHYLEGLPNHVVPSDDDKALAFARDVLDQALKPHDPSRSRVERLQFARIVADFNRLDLVETYALENRLARRDLAHKIEVTALGSAFLRLRGQDAVRWLMTCEVEQSTGASDPWRVSRALLKDALSNHGIVRELDTEGRPYFAFDVATLKRLARLDVIVAHADGGSDDVYCYRVDGAMRDLVQRVLDGGPWHAAVTALLGIERAAVLPSLGSRATDASIEQTQMIAHEVRNALIPVRHHIDALLKPNTAADRARLERSRHGVVRVLSFVDEMVVASELRSEQLTSVELGNVIRAALGYLDESERVEVDLSAGPLKVRAPRSRLQRAILNLLRNALQATTGGQRVRAQAHRSAGMIEIVVEDGGPGVPEEHRSSVFQDGFTTRGGVGGSGFGLAYVRRVVEELQGRVWCEAAEFGGARFVMALPEGKADR